jgi:hypothetical protein
VLYAFYRHPMRDAWQRRDGLDPHTQMLAAESIVDLSACRALLSRTAALIDEHHERNPEGPGNGAFLVARPRIVRGPYPHRIPELARGRPEVTG